MIKLMDMEYTHTLTERSTKATGRKINRMGMVYKPGQIRLAIKVTMNKARSKAQENSRGLIALTIRESFKTIIFMEKVIFLFHNNLS